MHPIIIAALLVAWLVGAVGSTVYMTIDGPRLWPLLTVVLQLTLAAQWWFSHREGGEAAKTADRLLPLIVATMVSFYSMMTMWGT